MKRMKSPAFVSFLLALAVACMIGETNGQITRGRGMRGLKFEEGMRALNGEGGGLDTCEETNGKGKSKGKSKSKGSSKSKCKVVRNEVTPTLIVNQVNEPGFGDLANKYSLAMASFNGYVYIGTLNAPDFPEDLLPWFLGEPLESEGAQVWRGKIGSSGKWEWEKVLDFGEFPICNPNNFGVREMLVVGDYLYFLTANHEGNGDNGVEVWQTSDGGPGTWTLTNFPGFGDPNNISGRSLAECGASPDPNRYLYAGVENRQTGAQLWRHRLTTDGALDLNESWEEVPSASNGFGNPNNYFVSDLKVYDSLVDGPNPNELYAGTLNGLNGMELWKLTSCGADDPADVLAVNIFDGGWPSGTCPIPNLGPIDLCVTNSGILTLETAMTNLGPALFLGTVNYIFGASLFVTFDGVNFIPIFLFGNGDLRLSYVWSMEVYQGRLYIGTFQRFNLLNSLASEEVPSDANVGVSAALTPDIPGLTTPFEGIDIDLDEVIETGFFTVFSLDLLGFNMGLPLVSVVPETKDSFGTCYQYGARTMAVYNNKLIIGGAGASSRAGTVVFQGVGYSNNENPEQ